MDAWQYSVLNAKFKALQNQLLGTVEFSSTISNSESDHQMIDVEMSADQNLDTNKGSLKRKADDQHSNDKLSKSKFIMMLDTYTQTEASFVADSRKDTAEVVSAVMENQRRLDHVESMLESMEEKLDLLIGEYSEHSKARISSSGADIKRPGTLQKDSVETVHTPIAPENPIISEAALYTQSQNNVMKPQPQPQVTCHSSALKCVVARTMTTQPYVLGDCSQSSGQGTSFVSKTELSNEKTEQLHKGMELNILDASPHLLVPVIIACNSKTERNLTTEVPLQDLVNGNRLSLEGVENINLSRGCWLGDKLDPDCRVWYCGDVKIIHRAEASGTNPAKLSLNLLEALFTRDEMAASNVNGARGRELLDPIKIKAVQGNRTPPSVSSIRG